MTNLIVGFIKIVFMIVFWPITILWFIFKPKSSNKKPVQTQRPSNSNKIRVEMEGHELVDYGDLAEDAYNFEQEQIKNTVNIINSSTDMPTVMHRIEFLFDLKQRIIDDQKRYRSRNFTPLIDEVSHEIAKADNYINATIIRGISKLDLETVGSTPAQKKRRYRTFFRNCEKHKLKMCEENIKTYTSLVQQRLEIDTLSLPQYSALLVRLNGTRTSDKIPPEYYSSFFQTDTQAKTAMIKAGYLSMTEDGAYYILTEDGIKETGWL